MRCGVFYCLNRRKGTKTTYTVDGDTSRNEEVVDRLGNKTAYEYDASGRTTKVTSKDAHDTELANISYAYDTFDNMTEIVRRIDHKESISVTELDEACNYSVTSFRRIFTHYFYCSPQQYISICRIRLAKQLLSTSSHSITDIADMVGFENISGFNRAFKNITGVSPSKYRSSLSE